MASSLIDDHYLFEGEDRGERRGVDNILGKDFNLNRYERRSFDYHW